MENNIGLFSTEWVRNQSNTAIDTLRMKQGRILSLLDYDISMVLSFNEQLNVATVKTLLLKDKDSNSMEIPDTIFINKSMYYPIKKLVDTMDYVENQLGDYRLISGMESELYIPLFEPAESMEESPKLIGCLYLGSTNHKEFSPDWNIDYQIGTTLSDISKLLLLEFIKSNNNTNLLDLTSIFVDILGNIELYLPSHSFSVSGWAKEIGIALGYSDDKLYELTIAGLIHDIGKSMVNAQILNKRNKLTDEEYGKIKLHSVYGARIVKYLLKGNPKFHKVPQIIKHHHERYDGKGYPDGLKGNEVPFESYIIGIADAVDIMLMGRPYERALSLNEIIVELYTNKGRKFHPKLVDIMVSSLTKAQKQSKRNALFGIQESSIILNTKDGLNIIEGILIDYNNYYVFKPFSDYDVSNIDLSSITNVEMAVKGTNSLDYYEVKLEDLQNGLFYISSAKLVPTPNSFSLTWMLDGILYGTDTNKEIPMTIVKIGGNSMLFYVPTNEIEKDIHQGIPLKVKILFEEENVDITGTIIKTYNFGAYKYFDLCYTNIPDSKRDIIYRQLFKRQIELRKTIAKYS